MHQQIGGSPNDTASNVGAIVNALARRGINIAAIAPAFDAPHVRVLVEHEDMDAALDAMAGAGLAPQIHSAVLVEMPNTPGALKKAMDRLTRAGYVVESILVLPGEPTRVSFGIRESGICDWNEDRAGELGGTIGNGLGDPA